MERVYYEFFSNDYSASGGFLELVVLTVREGRRIVTPCDKGATVVGRNNEKSLIAWSTFGDDGSIGRHMC